MKHKNISLTVITTISTLVFAGFIGVVLVSAQPSTPTPATPHGNPTTNQDVRVAELENRLSRVETALSQQIGSLNESNEYYRSLLTWVSGFIALVALAGGTFQIFVTVTQLRRESARDSVQAEHEKQQSEVQNAGVHQVSAIMNVVKSTLESRLDAEKEARDKEKKTSEDLASVLKDVGSLGGFFKKFQTNIRNSRDAIETNDSKLAQTPRHGFRPMTNDLNIFAGQFDTFTNEYEPLEEEPRRFSTKVLYIRGIAAHYANQPEIAKRNLVEVTSSKQLETGDTDNAYKRRIANAYYYLGLTDSNFGNAQDAIDSFEHAKELDPDGTDFLTKVVTAEALAMRGVDQFDKAQQILSDIHKGLDVKRDREGRLGGIYLRLKSRATLIQSNMTILKGEKDWRNEVVKLLEPICNEDPGYYYVTATLGQMYNLLGKSNEAQSMFRQAYEFIERSGDFLTIKEVRSQILLQMVSDLCCRHGLDKKKMADEHLDKADSLRNSLPKIGSQDCTVFSILSKCNEKSDTIHDHIELMRQGKVLLEKVG